MNLVFIVGSGRCGSSLVHEIIARHKKIGFISNIDDKLPFLNLKGRWNNSLFRTPVGLVTRKGRIRFAPSEAYNLITHRVSPIYANSCRDLDANDVTQLIESKFQTFFQERAKRQGNKVFIHKYTGWSRISFFSKIFPNAKFVHIIRDGRAVANSWLQMPWWNGYRGPDNWLWGNLSDQYYEEWMDNGKSFVLLAGIGWKILMDSYEQSSQLISNTNYLQLRYEDFLENPMDQLKLILSFIDEPWSMDFEKHFRKQVIHIDRHRAFETDLTPAQNDMLRTCLAEKLALYGYDD